MAPPHLSRRTILTGGAAAAILPLAGCAPTLPAARGNVLNQLLPWEPTSLSLLTTADSAIATIAPKMMEGLIAYDEAMQPIPALATAWEVSDDQRHYVFHLRKGVRWHDGKPFTADDVIRSLGLLKQYHPQGRVTFATISGIASPDPHTVTLTLDQPVPYLLLALMASQSPIVPAHIYPADENPSANAANVAPIGTGPFRFAEWQRGSFIKLACNEHYWAEQQPALDAIYMKVVPDLGARAAAFETGQLDYGGDTPLPLPEITRFARKPGFAADRKGYSYSPAVISMTFNLDRPALRDLRVRQAVAHAVDRRVVADICWQGYAIPSPSPISPQLARFYADDVPVYPFDPARARALLREAGHTDLTLDLVISTAQTPDLSTGYYIKQALAHAGIAVNLITMDQPTFVRTVFTARRFDLFLAGFNNGPDPTMGVQKIYSSKGFKVGVPYSNGSHYANPEVDALLDAAAVEVDPDRRRAQFRAFQHIVARDVPAIPLVTKQPVTIVSRRVRGADVAAEGPKGSFGSVSISHA